METTWFSMTIKFRMYLELANQDLIEPIGLWKNVNTNIMGMDTKIEFEVIDRKIGDKYFPALNG